jgi:hypothetical protein
MPGGACRRDRPDTRVGASTSITRNARALRKTEHERNVGDAVTLKLKQPQRVFIVQCGFAVLLVAVAIGCVTAQV